MGKDYLVFILGYDLLQDYFKDSEYPECDLVYEECNKIIEDFESWLKDNDSIRLSTYDLLVKYLKEKNYIK